MKKLLSMVLCLAMMFSLATPALATSSTAATEIKGEVIYQENSKSMSKENSVILFLGILTCALSLLDFSGQTFHIKRQYRDLPWRRKWQIKNAIYELTFGGGVLLLQPIQKLNFRPLTVVVGCLAIIAFILMILNDSALKKGPSKRVH